MSKFKIICLIIVLILFVAIGCSKDQDINNTINNNTKEENNTKKENNNESDEGIIAPIKQEEETNTNNKISIENYKNILITNYEKYIKPLDLEEYDDIKLVASTKGLVDNDSLINEYKAYINDNRTNLKSFEQSMVNLNIEDSKIKVLNEQLVKECKIYIRDLDKIESYLEVIDQNTLEKSREEFISYLEDIIDNDDIEHSKFENIIIETQNNLGITLD